MRARFWYSSTARAAEPRRARAYELFISSPMTCSEGSVMGMGTGRGRRTAGRVIAAEPVIGPRGGTAQALVLDHGRMGEEIVLASVVSKPLVGAQPDAVAEAVHLAAAVAGAAARPVALVLRALRLGAEVGDLRQRAVAAVAAAEE